MPSREEFNACMAAGLKGKALSKDERKAEFCIVAKQCSKGVSRKEASRLCAEAAANPKAPQLRKGSRSRFDSFAMAKCIISQLPSGPLTADSLSHLIVSCSGGKVKKPATTKSLIAKCVRDKAGTGDFRDVQRVHKDCAAQVKAQG